MAEPDAEARYQRILASFDDTVTIAGSASRAAAGRRSDQRRFWASVLFTRICTTGCSILCLSPRSHFAGRFIDHYDFSALALLSRNLAETYLAFFYLCNDDVPEDEWRTRVNVFDLHDCVSRLSMFREIGETDLSNFQQQAIELRERLKQMPYFAALPEKRQRHLLKGEVALMVTQDHLLKRLGVDVGAFRGLYRLFSSHVHTFPLSFYRMAEREQGRGTESDWEKEWIATALEFAESPLRRSIYDYLKLFPEIRPATENLTIRPPPVWRNL